MNQGEVWTLPTRQRALVVSNDSYSEIPGALPLCVPLVRQPRRHSNDLVVVTSEQDLVTGSFMLPSVGRASLTGATLDGLITGPTMSAVSTRLARLFAH